MTGLRERIEAERAALLDERAIAKAATPGPWRAGDYPDEPEVESEVAALGEFYIYMGPHEPGEPTWTSADARHIARQDPTATIARIDRELARIDADLALLERAVKSSTYAGASPGAASWGAMADQVILPHLNARYPEVTA